MSARAPAVAGQFYPGTRDALVSMVDECLGEIAAEAEKAIAVVSPHAGFVYSGRVAGQVFASVSVPDRAIVLGPKHRPWGAPVAVSGATAWRFPFGEVPVDPDLSRAVARHTGADMDDAAHRDEHSLEVQLPFLWRRNPNVRIAALAVGSLRKPDLARIGLGLARAVREAGGPVLLVASTDMSHYIPASEAARLDDLAIRRVIALDPDGLYDTVTENDISMCGVMPTTAVLHAARDLGGVSATLVRYAHSGEVNGDTRAVVGYAGIVIR